MTSKGQYILDRIISEFKTGDNIGCSIIQRKYIIGYNLAYSIMSELEKLGHLTETELSHLGMCAFNKINK